MSKKLYLPLALLLALGMILSACGPAQPTEAEPPVAVETEAPAPTPEPTEEVADRDGVFGDMLANMAG